MEAPTYDAFLRMSHVHEPHDTTLICQTCESSLSCMRLVSVAHRILQIIFDMILSACQEFAIFVMLACDLNSLSQKPRWSYFHQGDAHV
jgi:hypothetical protein